jgi:serine/threonine protein kinase
VEFIRGTNLLDLCKHWPKSLPLDHRYNIVRKVFEAEFDVSVATDVLHIDYAPRNVIVCSTDLANPFLRVVLIDFGYARIERFVDSKYKRGAQSDPPGCPAEMFWSCSTELSGFGWLPSDPDREQDWLLEQRKESDKYPLSK